MSLRAIKLRPTYAGFRVGASRLCAGVLFEPGAEAREPLGRGGAVHGVEHVEQVARERRLAVAGAEGAVAALRRGWLVGRLAGDDHVHAVLALRAVLRLVRG